MGARVYLTVVTSEFSISIKTIAPYTGNKYILNVTINLNVSIFV